MDNKSLGELIRKKRKEKQMTQGQLADLLYVSTNAVSKWELGKNSIDPQNLARISELLDIPRSLLFDEPPEIPSPRVTLTNTDTTGLSPPPPEINNDKTAPPEPVTIPMYITEKETGRRKIPFMLLGIGWILIAAAFIVCLMCLRNRASFSIRDKYFDVYEGESACYLIAEYSGELTTEVLYKYAGVIREKHADYFNEVNTVVVLFCQDYSKNGIISSNTADAILVLNPDPL